MRRICTHNNWLRIQKLARAFHPARIDVRPFGPGNQELVRKRRDRCAAGRVTGEGYTISVQRLPEQSNPRSEDFMDEILSTPIIDPGHQRIVRPDRHRATILPVIDGQNSRINRRQN